MMSALVGKRLHGYHVYQVLLDTQIGLAHKLIGPNVTFIFSVTQDKLTFTPNVFFNVISLLC